MADTKDLDIDMALKAAGSWNRFQQLILFMSFWAAIPNAFLAMHFVFSQYEPHHHCTYPVEYNNYVNQSNANSEIISAIIPMELNQESISVLSQCKMYDRNYSQYPVKTWPEVYNNTNDSKIIGCKDLTYEIPESEDTAVMEFSMVCENDWKEPLVVSLYSLGMALGISFGLIADKYGRRPVFIAACVVQIISQILDAVSWSFVIHCIAVTLSGLCGLANYIVFFVLATEITDYEWRNFLSISSTFGFSTGYCSVALFAYLFRKWRIFIGVMAVAATIIYIPCCWYFPESPRWLAQKGRSNDAIRYLRLIARFNRRTKIFEETLESQNKSIVATSNMTTAGIVETIKVLLKSGITSRFFATAYGWFITSTVYFALSIYSTDFSEDRFINFFLGGLVEMPACLVGFVLLKYIGRPRTTLLLMSTCGLSSIVLPFISKDLQALSSCLAILGKGSIAAVFFAWYLISSEVVPTLQRSSAMSVCSTLSRVGSFSSSYLMYLRKYNYWIPNMVMGVASISSGLLGIFLIPETRDVQLPATVNEALNNQRFYRVNLARKFPEETSDRKKVPDDKNEEAALMIEA